MHPIGLYKIFIARIIHIQYGYNAKQNIKKI